MNFGTRDWYEFVFAKMDAKEAWEYVSNSTVKEEYRGQRKCAETVYREIWKRLPGELSPEELLQKKREMIEQLKAEIADAEAEPVVDPVKDVPVEVVIPPPVDPPVEEPKVRKRGRPSAMTLADLNPK